MIIASPRIKEILLEEFMIPNKISAYKLSKDIKVSAYRIYYLLKGKGKIDVDLSIRLGIYFGVSETYFLNIQNEIDYRNLKNDLSGEFDSIKPHDSH